MTTLLQLGVHSKVIFLYRYCVAEVGVHCQTSNLIFVYFCFGILYSRIRDSFYTYIHAIFKSSH